MHKLNILVAGKSGVGKSSLLNYIVGQKELFETGEGAPITQDYFHKHVFKSSGIEYHLFDTKGVEPNTTEEFSEELTSAIHEYRDDDDVFEHIHTLYYCFGANNRRIEPFEVAFIKQMNGLIDVIIVLTKSDLVSDSDIAELIAELKESLGEETKVVTVCSVSKKLRIGEVSPFGKEELLNHAFMGLWNTFSKKVPRLFETLFFSREVKVYTNDVTLRRSWYRFFGSEIFSTDNRKNIHYNLYTFFKLKDFKDVYFKSFDSKAISLFSLLINKSENLLINPREFKQLLDDLILDCESTYKKILDFYALIAGENVKYKPLRITKSKIIELGETFSELCEDMSDLNRNFSPKLLRLKKDPTWFGGDEEELGEEFYNYYLTPVSDCYQRIQQDIERIGEVFQTELYQFGDILLKDFFEEELIEEELKSVGQISDLSNNQKIYYHHVKRLAESRVTFDSTLRDKLDFLRDALSISYHNAGLIEDFCRTKHSVLFLR